MLGDVITPACNDAFDIPLGQSVGWRVVRSGRETSHSKERVQRLKEFAHKLWYVFCEQKAGNLIWNELGINTIDTPMMKQFLIAGLPDLFSYIDLNLRQ